jgi:hypothetical protein
VFRKLVAGSIIATAVLVIASPVALLLSNYYNDKTKVCTVAGKDRVWVSDSNGGGHSEMRIYTDDCGTFVVSDSLIKGKFNSADTFGRLKDDHKYTFTYHGWRVGFLSAFPTITDVTEVTA